MPVVRFWPSNIPLRFRNQFRMNHIISEPNYNSSASPCAYSQLPNCACTARRMASNLSNMILWRWSYCCGSWWRDRDWMLMKTLPMRQMQLVKSLSGSSRSRKRAIQAISRRQSQPLAASRIAVISEFITRPSSRSSYECSSFSPSSRGLKQVNSIRQSVTPSKSPQFTPPPSTRP